MNIYKYAQICTNLPFHQPDCRFAKENYDVYVSPGNNRSMDFGIDDLISV